MMIAQMVSNRTLCKLAVQHEMYNYIISTPPKREGWGE